MANISHEKKRSVNLARHRRPDIEKAFRKKWPADVDFARLRSSSA